MIQQAQARQEFHNYISIAGTSVEMVVDQAAD